VSLDPPASWSPKSKAHFPNIPAHIQQAVAQLLPRMPKPTSPPMPCTAQLGDAANRLAKFAAAGNVGDLTSGCQLN
jgi:hypothetical protein